MRELLDLRTVIMIARHVTPYSLLGKNLLSTLNIEAAGCSKNPGLDRAYITLGRIVAVMLQTSEFSYERRRHSPTDMVARRGPRSPVCRRAQFLGIACLCSVTTPAIKLGGPCLYVLYKMKKEQ